MVVSESFGLVPTSTGAILLALIIIIASLFLCRMKKPKK